MAIDMETTDDPYLRHLFDGTSAFNVYREETTNLSVGAPGPDLLQRCVEMLKRATDHRLYGITPGLWECREELAGFLTRRYGNTVKREDLILSCGATHGLQLLLNTILSPNGVIFVEEVTYMIALDVFRQFPFLRVVTVPMKDDVVDLDAFEKIAAEEERKGDYLTDDRKLFWAMFYTIPTFHNPTGTTLPAECCERLVDIARKRSMLVCCDDVYNLLYYGKGSPPRRLFSYDDPADPEYKGGNVVSNGSLSKILSPGLRFGWIECSPRVARILRSSGVLRSGGAVNHYVSGLIASLLQLNIQDNYLDELVRIYRERSSALCDVLDRCLPRSCSYRRPEGGYFAWIHLPSGMDGSDFVQWCLENYKVSAIPGVRFSYAKTCKNFLRLSIAFHGKQTLESSGEILCRALVDYIGKNPGCD